MNIFESIPPSLPSELIDTLAVNDHIRIERIVSHGHNSPEGFWYDQAWHEWVLLLRGAATLRFEHTSTLVTMKPGDAISIPAHTRHRVETTTPEEATVWLAVHYEPKSTERPKECQ